jgi:chemotaxis protein MotB
MSDNKAAPSAAPIIIKKKKGGHGHGHHGGAWKVAYADFVTAMMAFFLLMWLLNATTEEQRLGISNYFTPDAVSRSMSGGGDILAGSSLSRDSKLVDPSLPPINAQPTDMDASQERKPLKDNPEQDSLNKDSTDNIENKTKKEAEAFQKATEEIKQAIQQSPELAKLVNNIIVEQTQEGLRIQIIDQEKLSLFPLGSAQMYDYTKQLLAKIAQIVTKLPNKIKISGHTDSAPYPPTASYTNWELSSDRANASRRVMVMAGVPSERVAWVVGSGDTEHLFPEDPTSPRNRRVSIVLLRDSVYRQELASPTTAPIPKQ